MPKYRRILKYSISVIMLTSVLIQITATLIILEQGDCKKMTIITAVGVVVIYWILDIVCAARYDSYTYDKILSSFNWLLLPMFLYLYVLKQIVDKGYNASTLLRSLLTICIYCILVYPLTIMHIFYIICYCNKACLLTT